MRVRRGKTRRKNAACASTRPALGRRKAYLKRTEMLLSTRGLLSMTPSEIKPIARFHPKEGCPRLCLQIRKADDITQPPRYEQAYFR